MRCAVLGLRVAVCGVRSAEKVFLKKEKAVLKRVERCFDLKRGSKRVFSKSDIDKLKVKYVSMVIETISIAFPVCINAVPAKTKTRSGYAIAAANDEYFVKFKY